MAKKSIKYAQKKKIQNSEKIKQREKEAKEQAILKKKNRRLKLVKGLATGIVGLSLLYSIIVGATVISDLKYSPYKHTQDEINDQISYVQMYNQDRTVKNIKTIIEIAPKGSIVYTEYFAAKNQFNYPIYDQSRIYKLKACKEIKVNFNMNVTKSEKEEIAKVVEFFNSINENTFTGIPPMVVEYNSPSTPYVFGEPYQGDSYTITITEEGKNIFGNLSAAVAVTYVGTGKIYVNSAQNLSPSLFATTILHELMHEVYGFDDMYLHDNFSNTRSTLMNAVQGAKFSLNDLYIIDALCWTDELTLEQKQHLREYYKEFADSKKAKDIFSILAYKIEDLIKPLEYADLEKE